MAYETLLINYKNEVKQELKNILDYWMEFAPDKINGGFFGKINDENIVCPMAPKGAVLNARICWTFAAAYNQTGQQQYLDMADRAYNYLVEYFVDKEYGGTYWSVDFKGQPLDTKKQIYALTFLQYACSEYQKCSFYAGEKLLSESQSLQASAAINKPAVTPKELSIQLYKLIELHSFDKAKGGYYEAFTKDWKPLADMRLSEKDANEQKTMNTHLHVLESYTNLYRIWPDEKLKESIWLLLAKFATQIYNAGTHHLQLFFNEDWVSTKQLISYGHDIEAAWLMQEAAEVIEDNSFITLFKKIAIELANGVEEGLDDDGGLWYEKEKDHLVKQKHWWPQAEAMVGFLKAWQITGENKYLQHSANAWKYIQKNLLNKQFGEWYWGIDEAGKPMPGEDKAGFWKCPYHNARACMEVIKRIKAVTNRAL